MIPLPTLDTLDVIVTAFDAQPTDARVNWMRGLGKRELVALWEKAEGRSAPITALHGELDQVVIHEGQNSLPLFNVFQKRVMRRTGAGAEVVQGYNHQAMSWITGPGHFLVRTDGTESWFDYTEVAATAPSEFPPIKNNEGLPDKLVYGGMIDKLRRVGQTGLIGAAFRGGKATGDYFMLVRR